VSIAATVSGSPSTTINRLASLILYKGVLTAEHVRAEYLAGIPFIESPTPDTLYSSRLQFASADWLSGRVVMGDSARVEMRDDEGAVLDTFMCTGCGTIRDAKLERTPSADSLALWMVGSTGTRRVGMNPRLYNFAAAEWPREEYWIGRGPVVADSSGAGHVWKIQDAIAAAYNVGQRAVDVMRGKYPTPVTDVYTGMTVRGVGYPLVTNEADTSKAAFTVATGDSVTIQGLRLYTAPGGEGNSMATFTAASGADYGTMRDVTVMDSDTWGFGLTSAIGWRLDGCKVMDADTYGIYLGAACALNGGRYVAGGNAMTVVGANASAMDAVFSGGASPIVSTNAADTLRFIGNRVNGDVSIVSGIVKAIVTNNQIIGNVVDSGTGTIEANNAQ